MDGCTATQKIKEFNRQTPFIALTSSTTVDIEQKISEAGKQDFVTMPFNPDDLFIKIRTSIASCGE